MLSSARVDEFSRQCLLNSIAAFLRVKLKETPKPAWFDYDSVLTDVSALISAAKFHTAKQINSTMTGLYWRVGRRIVQNEQHGELRAGYGKQLLQQLSEDLTSRFGRGYSVRNLRHMRSFFLGWSSRAEGAVNRLRCYNKESYEIRQALPAEFKEAEPYLGFPLPWTSYVLLISVKNPSARSFYETEAVRGGWTTRQLKRQIQSKFFERVALSKDKASALQMPTNGDGEGTDRLPELEIRNPFVLEFLNLKDEYSESDLEESLVKNLEAFLLELGSEFCFVGRQKRLRIGSSWFRVDLIFFHRVLRCLVIIDLKIGAFSHADAGQMHMYLNYAREHWTNESENPPVGLILCASKDADVAHYALEGLPNKVLARDYRTVLPKEAELIAEIERVRAELDNRL